MKKTHDGKPTGTRTRKGRVPSSDIVSCYVVDQTVWNIATGKGQKCRLTVIARTMTEALQLAGDDEIHQNELCQCVGPVCLGISQVVSRVNAANTEVSRDAGGSGSKERKRP